VPGQVVGGHRGAVHVHRHPEVGKQERLIDDCDEFNGIGRLGPLPSYDLLMN